MSTNQPIYKLLDWIDENKLDWARLSLNFNAIKLLEENQDKINWDFLSFNKNAIHLLEQNLDKINWLNLSENKNAIKLLEQNQDKINWEYLSYNINAIKLLEKKNFIYWDDLSINSSILPGNRKAIWIFSKTSIRN